MTTGQYAIVPTPEVNSNSAAFAIADKATEIASGNSSTGVDRSSFSMMVPGAAASPKVEFKCTPDLKAAHGC
jgi:hypothetical protein